MSRIQFNLDNSTVDGRGQTGVGSAESPFFELAEDVLCVIDFAGQIQQLNPVGEEILGESAAQIRGKPLLEWVHPEDRTATREQIEKLQEGREAIAFENRICGPDNSQRRFSWKATSRPQEELIYAIGRETEAAIATAQPHSATSPPKSAAEEPRQFFNLGLDLFAIFGFDGYLKSVNPAWENTLGFSQSELLTKPFIDFVHPEDHSATLSEYIKLLQGVKSVSFENRYKCKDGSYKWLRWTANPVVDKQKIYAIAHDISDRKIAEVEAECAYEDTRQFLGDLERKLQSRSLAFSNAIHKLQNEVAERRQVEEELQKEREFLKALLNSVDAGIIACDAEGNITLFNRATREFYGLPDSALSPSEWSNYYELYYPEKTTAISEDEMPLLRALNGEAIGGEQMAIVPQQGKTRIVLASGEAIFDPEGHKIGAMIVLHDITESQQKQQALSESSREKNELIASLQAQAEQLQQALQQLQRTQTQLIQSEKMSSLGQLVAGVAHEINNPVNFIYGNIAHANDYLRDLLELLSLYQQYYPNPVSEIEELEEDIDLSFLRLDLPKLLDSMKVGAERIRQIVQSLRNFSRLNEAQMKRVNLHEGLDSTLLVVENRFKDEAGNALIKVVKDYSDLPKVECYPSQLNQGILNILNNAIDALESVVPSHSSVVTGDSSLRTDLNTYGQIPNSQGQRTNDQGLLTNDQGQMTIQIRTEVVGDRLAVIRIQDNGPGMSPEVKEKIFNPFFTTKPVGKGTGLGLSVAYQIIVNKHGGVLNCYSELGHGTEFVIHLPIRQPNYT